MKLINIEDTIKDLDNIKTEKDINKFLKKYRKMQFIDIVVTNYAEELVNKKDYDKGIMIIKALKDSKYFDTLSDDITVYFILARHYINNGEIEKGKKFLTKIANETTDNYEESLEFRGYLDEWNKLKHLVENDIKESKAFNTKEDLSDEELLDLLMGEVHSGGYDAYLTYNAEHFEDTLRVAKSRNLQGLTAQLERIKAMFPNNEIPQNPEDAIEELNLNFDNEDDLFYSTICNEIDL